MKNGVVYKRLAVKEASVEQTDNILWLLKQAWYFSLTTVNDAVSEHGVSTAQIGMMRQLATEPGCPAPTWPVGC